jgi:hypothetical protein
MTRCKSLGFLLPILIDTLTDCAAFRSELPQVLYIARVSELTSSAACKGMGQQFAEQTALRVVQQRSAPTRPSPARYYCEVNLNEAGGNHDVVSLSWAGDEIRLLVHHRTAWGTSSQPNAETRRLAGQLAGIVKLRYPAAAVREEKAYSNPLFD